MLNTTFEKFDIYQKTLIVLLLFVMTINSTAAYTASFLILLAWLIPGDLKQRGKALINNDLSLSFLLLFVLHCIGLLWTESWDEGLKILSKQKIYLFAPIVIALLDKRYAQYALTALLSAILISEFHSIYLYYFAGIPIDKYSNPSPYMHHMHYSLILSFTFGLMISLINVEKGFTIKNAGYLSFALLTLFVLFMNRGRIGQLSLPAVLFVLAIWKFKVKPLRSIFVVLVSSAILFTAAYNFSEQFKVRIERVTYEFTEVLNTDKRASIVCRFEMWQHATAVGSTNVLTGVGTGDSIVEMKRLMGEDEFAKLFKECNLGITYQFNPHNNFALVYMQFGLLGVAILLTVLFLQIRLAIRQNSIPMGILLAVSITGMLTTSLISMHVKYMFFFALTQSALYVYSRTDAKTKTSNSGLS